MKALPWKDESNPLRGRHEVAMALFGSTKTCCQSMADLINDYGIVILDGPVIFVVEGLCHVVMDRIKYCPWCGKRFACFSEETP